MKKVIKIFIIVLLAEILLTIILSSLEVWYPNPCATPDFFHPFGKESTIERACAQMLAIGPSPLFYFSLYALYFTVFLFITCLICDRLKKFLRRRK